ncbi:MAG: glycosyltransferase [Deltaproteobacteria bacterium]|nr:glycosyltransferase [Deltaproteobacteria bacterium]
MSQRLRLLVTAKLIPSLLERYLEPLDALELVERIVVVRHEPAAERLAKVENVTFGDGGTARNLVRMGLAAERVIERERIDWILGFNPIPWGTVGWTLAKRHRIPVSLSFIGLDFKHLQHPLGTPFWLPTRTAELVTVTGERMRRRLLQGGVRPERIHTLPHAVDTARFSPSRESTPDLDVIAVGQLIPRKRMDVLIDAVALLRDRGVSLRAGILGKGPLADELAARIRERGVGDRVELLGYRTDVENALRRARVFALVSDWEGVPFAMIEAMSAGLVPVVTDVGTIGEWVTDGVNGRIVPVGDAAALADALRRLKEDGEHRAALQRTSLEVRDRASLDAGVAVWRRLLTRSA